MAARVTLTVERLGDVVTAIWCERCLLPSAIAQAVRIDRQLKMIQHCRTCGAWRNL